MAHTPDISCQCFSLLRRKLRPTHRRHRTAIFLWLRHTVSNRSRDSREAAIAPQPFLVLARERRPQRRALAIITVAARASRSAHLPVIYPSTQGHHCGCRAFGHRSIALSRSSRASIRMRALRRFRGCCNGSAGRSGQARAWRHVCGATFCAAKIDDAVNPSAYVIGNVQRTVWSHRQARGTMGGLGRGFLPPREAIRKYFALAGRALPGERLKDYVVATLRIRRSIPRAVERDEDAVM